MSAETTVTAAPVPENLNEGYKLNGQQIGAKVVDFVTEMEAIPHSDQGRISSSGNETNVQGVFNGQEVETLEKGEGGLTTDTTSYSYVDKTMSHETSNQATGKDGRKSDVSYHVSAKADSATMHQRLHEDAYGEVRGRKVGVKRTAEHPMTGDLEKGAVKTLTGKRAERATKILMDRAVRKAQESKDGRPKDDIAA